MSGTTGDKKAGPVQQATVQEVQGVFPGNDAMQTALSELALAGYDRADFSLPEEEATPGNATPDESAEAPTDDSDKRQLRTMGAGMAGYAGAVAVAGATIATGGAALLAVAAAAAVGAGSAVAANSVGRAVDNAQVTERDRRGAAGTLILAVRTNTSEQAEQVMALMHKAGATKVRPVTRVDQAITAGTSAAGWTG